MTLATDHEPPRPSRPEPTTSRGALAGAIATALALCLLSAWLVVRAARPPAPVPATAPATTFSAERAMRHVRAIAERPHPIGGGDHARVRGYVMAQLTALGLTPEVQEATGVGTRYQAAGRVRNVMARLSGTRPGGSAVLLMAHYDGVPAGPAAGDDASGSAVLLETLRALRAGPPLTHDIIALFTDGEEAGLLGAAAFVREHPWAKDIGVALNFEARGTTGRSYMFETGPGNLDVARALRGVGDVSATSLSVTVYRTLPNDTDLSELAPLARPALNFAFADGVERYHTTSDDVAHLNPGSVQHAGTQALALARTFGDGPLPRPATGDAVFFDLPLVGLVVHPESWAMPIAIIALLLTVLLLWQLARREARAGRDVVLGVIGTLAAVGLGAGAAMLVGPALARLHQSFSGGGSPAWSGVYGAAMALLALALAAACWSLARRWASAAGAHAGAIVVWTVLAVLASRAAPGTSFMLVWPLIAITLAALVALRAPRSTAALVARWIGTIIAAAVLIPIIYSIGTVLLGVVGPGGVAVGILVPLLAWLVAPQIEAMDAARRGATAVGAVLLTLLLFAVGAATVRRGLAHPTPSMLAYAMDADGSGAWLVTPERAAGAGSWAAAALGPAARAVSTDTAASGDAPPAWLTRTFGRSLPTLAAPAPRLVLQPPEATVLSDSVLEGRRRLTLRIRAAEGTRSMYLVARAGTVLAAAVDGRAIDTSRYRNPSPRWSLTYVAPPDSGIVLALTVPARIDPGLEMIAWTDGVPRVPGISIPPRPVGVAPVQSGDGTVVYRRAVLAATEPAR